MLLLGEFWFKCINFNFYLLKLTNRVYTFPEFSSVRQNYIVIFFQYFHEKYANNPYDKINSFRQNTI